MKSADLAGKLSEMMYYAINHQDFTLIRMIVEVIAIVEHMEKQQA